jgi:hypothetical protein
VEVAVALDTTDLDQLDDGVRRIVPDEDGDPRLI